MVRQWVWAHDSNKESCTIAWAGSMNDSPVQVSPIEQVKQAHNCKIKQGVKPPNFTTFYAFQSVLATEKSLCDSCENIILQGIVHTLWTNQQCVGTMYRFVSRSLITFFPVRPRKVFPKREFLCVKDRS